MAATIGTVVALPPLLATDPSGGSPEDLDPALSGRERGGWRLEDGVREEEVSGLGGSTTIYRHLVSAVHLS